jgi:hypothetical protein
MRLSDELVVILEPCPTCSLNGDRRPYAVPNPPGRPHRSDQRARRPAHRARLDRTHRLRSGRPRRRRRALRTNPRRSRAHPRRHTSAQRGQVATDAVPALPSGPGPPSLGDPLLRPERRSLTRDGLAARALGPAPADRSQQLRILPRPAATPCRPTASSTAPPKTTTTVIAAYKADGLDIYITAENPGFAPLQVTDQTNDATAKVELGIDWHAHPPVTLAIGPVLHPDDAVASKVCALYAQAQSRTTSRNGRTPSKVDLAATCGATGAADRRSPGCDTLAHASPGTTPALGCARRGSRAPRRRPSPALAAAPGRRIAPAVP